MQNQSAFDEIGARAPKDSAIFVDLALDISDWVDAILKKKGMTRRELAQALGKTDSEVSKWISGLHNLTLKSIAKLSAVLDETIVATPQKFWEQHQTGVEVKIEGAQVKGEPFSAPGLLNLSQVRLTISHSSKFETFIKIETAEITKIIAPNASTTELCVA